jgi:hypothetical protein
MAVLGGGSERTKPMRDKDPSVVMKQFSED